MGSWRASTLPVWPIDRRFLGFPSFLLSINSGSSCPAGSGHRGPVTNEGRRCWRHIFQAAKILEHLRKGPSGPYMDGFAASLERHGYRPVTAVRYLRAAAHLGHFVAEQGADRWPTSIFRLSVSICEPVDVHGQRGDVGTTTRLFGAKLFRAPRRQIGVCAPAVRQHTPSRLLAVSFKTVAAQASRGRRTHRQTVRSWCRQPDDGAWRRSDRMDCDRRTPVFSGTHEPMWQRHRSRS